MRKVVTVTAVLFLCAFWVHGKSLSNELDKLLKAETGKEQEKILVSILKEKPAADTLVTLLKGVKFKKPGKTGIVESENLCIDGVKRPFMWYIPESYDVAAEKAPLLVYLHGGVMMPDIIEERKEFVKESPFLKLADEQGYILLFPMAQSGATWFDSVGTANVLSQVRITKREFNIDDNRVFMTGFSDGASGSFFFGMSLGTDFAAFIPLNGHPGVGSIDFGIQTYFVNLSNCPLYVINTDLDRLYPDEKMRPMMELAQEAGADLMYRVYTGIGHDFDYAHEEMPLLAGFMETHPREVNPPHLVWETAYPEFGRCLWLAIDEIGTGGHAEGYEDHNMELVDDVVMFGFIPDFEYEGSGVRVAKVVGDSTLCALVGIQEGDIFIKLEGQEIDSLEDMNEYKATKQRGDSTEMTILREGEELTTKGKFPEPTTYMLFRRELPSARVEALFSGNTFYINDSQLGSFAIYIHPDMVQLDQNVVIYVGDRKVFDYEVEPSIEFILRNFLENRDKELIYINKIDVTIAE